MTAAEARDILFQELIVSREPRSLLKLPEAGHEGSPRGPAVAGVALERLSPQREGIVLFSACPSDWIAMERVRELVPEAGDVPIRILFTGPIFAAGSAGDGVSVAGGTMGSLGAYVQDQATRTRYLLSCNHVIAKCNAAAPAVSSSFPAAILEHGSHPTPATPGTHVANLDRFHTINFSPGAVNIVDAALGLPISTTKVCTRVGGTTVGVHTGSLPTPLDVQKVGITTGVTFGDLSFFASGFALNYGSGVMAIFDRQLGIIAAPGATHFALPGDSGAIVMDMAFNAVGLLFATTSGGVVSFANPIDDVLNATTGWNLKIV